MTLNHFIYKVARPFGGLQVARFLARNHPRILMYHRISPDGAPGTISVDQFRNHMNLIKKQFNPLPLSELVALHEQGTVPKNAVVITFDDGYRDFADFAFPIMKDEGVTATLFLTTGFVNGDLWLWPDQLKYLVNRKAHTGNFQLPSLDTHIDLNLSPYEIWSRLADYCMQMSNERKLTFIKKLYSINNIDIPVTPPEKYRPVTWQQVRKMVDDGLEVGCHSYSHPILTSMKEEELKVELLDSKKMIEKNIYKKVNFFCYPNGQESDTSAAIEALLSKYGYEYGVVAFSGINPLGDIWRIKRYAAPEQLMNFEKVLFGLRYIFNSVKK
ncbi:polysaccharide deacetylase family protein [Marinobacter sp.]|uniref:polysaccharide deacetylase family protein n=1 Tax=Marinobacter sp. TaxID=50741 RepID=UPI002B26D1F0|nr:polysaccharide deacetylase family protein [Marinobacter sp.]